MTKNRSNTETSFDIVLGFDMETDIGSFTPFYEGVKKGTLPLLKILKKYNARSTFYWTGHAAENNPDMLLHVSNEGHETGCHGLFHETLGDALFPLPNNWPILPSVLECRLRIATNIIKKISGKKPVSFRCPRLWGSTTVVNVLEQLGYISDASFPLYFYQKPLIPYNPSSADWTRPGKMKIVEIPNFCDLMMKSKDPYNRDRDQWPLFRTQSAKHLMKKVEGYIEFVQSNGHRPVVCFYLHPWEFYKMPQGTIDFGECSVKPLPFIVKNCGEKALKEFDILCGLLKQKGGRFLAAGDIAKSVNAKA